jgi:S-adenosylmethionine:tRNA ribosyltransferase-isomerase
MHREEIEFELPKDLIAQTPAEPRDHARLMVVNRATGELSHHQFFDLPDLLSPGDCLIVNDTRVVRARVACRRETGAAIEMLFQHVEPGGQWRVLLRPSSRLKPGGRILTPDPDVSFKLLENQGRSGWVIAPSQPIDPVAWLDQVGELPLPPYIARKPGGDPADDERYQTIYAAQDGAVAAPTAGLHFTPELFERLEQRGIESVNLTLHVGIGTFQPITVDDLADHIMHAERYSISGEALQKLARVRQQGGRLVAVGTTSVRVLESLPGRLGENGLTEGVSDWTGIFIYPPYEVRNVDALVTNFHLPGSSLIALVMALSSPEQVREAYGQAVARGYRFFSFGDAMLLL